MSRSIARSLLLLLCVLALVNAFALPKPQAADPAEVEDPNEPPEEPEAPEDPNDDGDDTPVLIGDLKNGITTPMGQSIANILLGTETGMSQEPATPPKTLGIAGCRSSKDKCCIWYSISADLTAAFRGKSGRCNAVARMAIRLGFHDAGTWSQKLATAGQDFGGADGSLVLFGEISRRENRGLEVVVALAKVLFAKYKAAGITMADLIQYMANHAVVTCPLAPRVRTFVGRKDATRAAPDGLLPSVSSNASVLFDLFNDKTISPHDVVALIGAHSTSQQFSTSPNVKDFGKFQDTTPGVWDVLYYSQTLESTTPARVFRFASDIAIANDPRGSGEWNRFINDQKHWNEDYAKAYVRLSLLGVNQINGMTECSKTLPAAQTTFKGSSEGYVAERRSMMRRSSGASSGCTR